ncbi:CFI-box-CTERM domain-containing protein [uncultured Acetatifactor sp.]|jgi:hypothetical protein|uniref:CFI-box-CTERM domain-containing protein n=1 Tax=uncultured Acetatifactor sp. TaxID=1671927 RepID=UPI0026391898|nr:CFI-box-CTERM domain-containing protein [uncultured Acetatifactor sp.]
MGFFGCDYLETIGTFLPEYRCKYSRQTLDSRTATDICMSSRYADCADYKNASRCFITTAVCLTLGKPDNCEELTLMRSFRDEWLREQPDGAKRIEEYYSIAPTIVARIDGLPERQSIYADIYKQYIKPCVENAERKSYDNCNQIYTKMLDILKQLYYLEPEPLQ